MSIMSKVTDFIATCPHLEEFQQLFPKVELDKLDEEATAYAVEVTPAEPIVKRFANGDTLRQYVFSVCSREWYGTAENVNTSEFYEKFAEWLEECTESRTLPELTGNLESKAIRATTCGYLYNAQENKWQYRIQCQFLYYKRR